MAKPINLFDQLLFSHLALVALSLLGLGGFTLYAIKENSYRDLGFQLASQAKSINKLINSFPSDQREKLLSTLEGENLQVALLNSQLQPIYGRHDLSSTEKQLASKVFKLGTSRSFEIRLADVHTYAVAVPYLDAGERICGVILVYAPLVNLSRSFGESFFTLLSLALLLILLTVTIIYALSNWISGPIKKVTARARQIASTGVLAPELPSFSGAEVQELSRSFNSMMKRLREEKAFQSEFITNASHELKTPVMAISSSVEVLARQAKAGEALGGRFLEIVFRQTERLRELIEDLLDLSILETGHISFEPTLFPVVDLVQECVDDLDSMASKGKVELSWFIASSSEFSLKADRVKLRRVLVNLLNNAIKHSPEGSEVILEVSEEANRASFKVIDQGSGISPDEQEQIFARFYRSQYDRSRATGGSGLGLAIVSQIVALHKGSLKVNSVLGEGSEFIVTLPQA